MKYKINVGDKMPAFRAIDDKGQEYTSLDLLGGPLVLYFYPKDETPGCTKEACSFRDNNELLTSWNAVVVGVSPDSVESHAQFKSRYLLNFSLFCDEHLEICRLFDVVRTKEVDGKKKLSIERTTFVIDPFGYIAWIERPVQVDGHSERVIDAVKKVL